ncbi:MAG: hypothetical protein J0I45_16455 [Bosea sp.]|nr:hypothetical protein [Bosea sp. (in: a-proteobacteria)]
MNVIAQAICGLLATAFITLSAAQIVGVITVDQNRSVLAVGLPVLAAFALVIYVMARKAARS